ncbi:MAG TPA: WD40 repeat domain-containing protein, partial [Anaerolineales bacterium]
VQISDITQGLESEPVTLSEGRVQNIVLSSDKQWLAGIVNGANNQEIRLWALNDMQAEPHTLTIPGEAPFTITALSFSSINSTQDWLAAGLDDGRVYRWPLQYLPQAEPILFPHRPSRSVTAMAFSPNGIWWAIAFSSSFGEEDAGASPFLEIWNLQNLAGEPGRIDLRDITISHLEFNNSSKWLAGASDDGTELSLWNMAVGSTSPPAQPLNVDGFNDIAFSPDDRWVAVAQQSKVEVWDLKKLFREGIELQGYKDVVLAAAFSHDSRTLATGNYDGQLHLWNTADFSGIAVAESQARVYNSFDVIVRSLAFSADDSQLAAAGDEQVRVWNFPETRSAPVRIADPQDYSILDDALLVQPSDDRLYAMDLTGEEPVIILQTEQNGALTYFTSPGERYLAVIDNRQIEIWDLQNPSRPIFASGEQEGRVIAPIFTADSRWFVYAVYDQIFAVDLQNPETATELSGNRNGSPVSEFFTLDHWLFSKSTSEVLAWDTAAASLSPHTKVSTSAGVPSVYPPGEDSTWIFTQQSGILSAWNTAESSAEALAFDGQFVEARDDRWLVLNTVDDGQQLWDLSRPDSPLAVLGNLEFFSSENWLAFYDSAGILQMLDLSSSFPQPVAVESFPDTYPWFSPNDQWLAVTSPDGESVTLYELTADLRRVDLAGSALDSFSPDGRWVVTTSAEGDSFFLHDVTGDLPMMELASGDLPLFFSPDGRWLVTTSQEEDSFDLYDLAGDLSKVEGADYWPIAFSPDERWLILEGPQRESALFDLEQRALFSRTYPPTDGLESSP